MKRAHARLPFLPCHPTSTCTRVCNAYEAAKGTMHCPFLLCLDRCCKQSQATALSRPTCMVGFTSSHTSRPLHATLPASSPLLCAWSPSKVLIRLKMASCRAFSKQALRASSALLPLLLPPSVFACLFGFLLWCGLLTEADSCCIAACGVDCNSACGCVCGPVCGAV